MEQSAAIQNGIFYLDGTPQFLISGDYPYYRDDPKYWFDRLQKMKKGGIQVVTFYVPWRHHFIRFDENGKQLCDFEGKTQENRNVKLFIELAIKADLLVCVKPGPFIHAETNYGGLPDFVNPDNNPKIQPWRNFLYLEGKDNMSKNTWFPFFGIHLPSPLDPEFLRLAKEYFGLVGQEVLKDRIYPQGPIVMLQLLNEGLFSEGRMPYSYSGDYSPKNLIRYRQFLEKRYENIEYYNEIHATHYATFCEILPPGKYRGKKFLTNLKQIKNILDWNDFGVEYYATWVNELATSLAAGANISRAKLPPLISNWNPEGDFGQGLDVWATRVNVEEIQAKCNVHYGYTNWIGAVNYRTSSYLRYSFLCGRANGINMEENWGFATIYDSYYKYGFVPLYQTLLANASGCTGYNVYTAVGTAHWDPNIDKGTDKPYPSDCPIDEFGRYAQKFYHMQGINKYFGEYFGQEFLECTRDMIVTIGLYQPNVQAAAFAGHDIKLWKKMGLLSNPVFGMDFLGHFHSAMRRLKLGYQIVNLAYHPFSPLNDTEGLLRGNSMPKFVIFPSTVILNPNIQEKLVNYVKTGGILCMTGDIPVMDENLEPCTILRDILGQFTSPLKASHMYIKSVGKGYFLYKIGNQFLRARGPSYYLTDLIVRFLMRLNLKIPGGKAIEGKVLPYSEAIGMVGPPLFEKIGGDVYNSNLNRESLRTITRLYKFMQEKGLHRTVDIQVRTIYKYRENLDVIVYTHPQKDVQHVFIFGFNCNKNLPVDIHFIIPQIDRRIHIKTVLVGHTAQLLRIEQAELTSFIYTGINLINHLYSPLDLTVNTQHIYTDAPTDLIYLKKGNKTDLIQAHNQRKGKNYLFGMSEKPIIF